MTGNDKKQVGNAQAISTLNKYFTTSGLSSVSDEEFGKAMQDSAGRQAIYDILVKRGLDVGDYDKFSTDFGFGIVTPEPEEVVVEPEVTSAPEQPTSQTKRNDAEVTTEQEDQSWRIGASQQLAALQRGIGAGKQVLSGIKLEAPRSLSETIVEQQKAMSNPTNVMRRVAANPNPEYEEQQRLFNNIKTGNIGDKEFAYLDNKRQKLLGDLKGILSQMQSDYKAMYQSQGGISHTYSPGAGAISVPSSNNSNSEELTTLADSIMWLEEEIGKLESITTKEDWKRNGHKGGFLKALGGNFSIFDMFTLGVIDTGANRTVSEILENGPKNKYEKYVADAAKAAGEMEYVTQGLGGQTLGSGGGAALGQSLEAMTPFIVGAPYFGGVSATVGLGKKALQAGTYMLGMTAMFPQYTATRYSQDKIDEYKQTGEVLDRTVWDRTTDAVGATAIEYFTEMFGGVVTARLFNKGRKLVPKGWLSAKLQFADNSAAKQLFQSLNLSNAVEEFEEELWSTALTPIAQGKSLEEIWNDWEQGFTIENLLTTALTVASMGAPRVAAMSVTGVAQAEHWRKKANTALRNIENTELKQTIFDAVRLETTEDVQRALAAIDWQAQDISDVQNAIEYINYKTYTYVAEGAEMSEAAKKEMSGKIAIIEGMAHEGIVRTAEYEGQPVYVTQMDSAGASVIMRMDGTQEQVATSALQKVEDTPVQEVIESIYAQEAPAIEQGLNEISEEGDMAEAEAAGVEYRPSSEVQRAFDEQEGREAPASGYQSGEVVSVDGKEGEIVSVDPYTRTARVEIDGVPIRVSFDQMSRVGQESEVSEVATPQEQTDVQERQYKVGEIITFRQPIFQEDGSVVEGDYIDAEVISVEANADGGYNVILRKQNGGQYGFNTAYGHPTIKEAEAQEQTSIAEEATTSIAEEVATPVAIQPITNEAGELDIRAMGEEQTAQYVTESGDTDYVESMLADRRKKLEKLQKNDKLPLNLAERQKAIAERNAEKARLEEEISMWEGVQYRLSQPQQTAEVESVATPKVAPVESVEQQAAQVAEAPTEVATAEAQQEAAPEQATQAEVQPQAPTATTATTVSTTATTNPHTQEQVEAMPFEVGVVMNDAARAMKPKSLDWFNKVAQALGVRIAFVDDVEGGLANGLYNRDTEKPTIYIAANRTAGEKFVIGHEMLHRMAQVAPDAYKAYKEFVLEELGGQEVSRRKKRITDHYKKYEMPVPSAETLAEEVVADFTGDIISAKGQVFEGFAKKIARKDTKLLRAFRNAVEHIRSFFKKGDAWEQNLTRRLKELDKLLAESVKAVEGSKPKAKRVRQSNFAENTRNAYRKEITAMFGGEYPSIEAEMLADIATGRVKFIRKNDGNKRGLESFFGNRPKELNSRIGITAKAENGGYSLDGYVHEFAQSPHHFWGNKTASEVDFDDSLIRDALESVLLTTSSPTSAMKQLREMHKTQNENPYEDEGYIESLLEDEQAEIWESYQYLSEEEYAALNELFAESYFDEVENNNNFAQNRQQDDKGRIVGENNAQREGQGIAKTSGVEVGYGPIRGGFSGETESEGGQADNGASTLRGARADRGDGERPELSVRLQQRRRVEQQAAQDIDSRIEQQQNKVRQLQNTYTQKKREIGEAYSQDNQGTLFEETTAPTDSLFEVERDFSQNNLNNILRPIQEELNAEIAELEALKSSREQFIADAVAAYEAQLEIGDDNTPSLYSLRGSAKSLVGIHNISLEKLQKAIKMGGLANPSVAVLDVDKTTHDDYGDISLILSSNMVDSRLGRNAGTWAGDAWTPTYPQVVKRINKKEDVSRFYRDINKMPEEMRNKVALDWNSFLEGRSAASMAYWFLFEKGEAPEMLTIPSRYPEDIVEQVRNVTNGSFSLYGLSPEERMAVVDIYIAQEYNGDRTAYEKALQDKVDKIKSRRLTHRSALVRKSAEQNLADINEYGFDYDQIADFVRDVERDYNHRGTVDVDGTIRSAQEYIKENGLQEEFDAWKSDLENRYDIREFIFNGYSNSGEKKWLPHTVENASRWMKKQGREGSVATFPSLGVFVAVAIPRMTSLASIRKRKSQLGKTEQEFNEFKDRWEQVYYELGQKLQPDANSFEDYGWWRLIEAVGQKNPREFIRRQYGIELSNSDVQQFNKLINAIRTNYPARYFETKFERPVQLSEFTAAVVPESTPEEVKTTLREEGLNVYEYDENVEGSRREATLDATDSISIRFSLRNTDTFYSNAEYAVRGIKQEKATPEQWLKMIEKAGGLKAGEDKWLGLSDWLKDKMRATPKEKPTTVTISGVEYNVKELEETILSEVKTILSENGFEDEIVGIRLVGSYVRGEQGPDSDIDVIVEYKGDSSEDGLFNVLNDEENRIRIEGVEVDINPITEGKSGTLDEWERRNSGFTKKPNTLTKQEVLDYINANKIVVEDVAYGELSREDLSPLQEEFDMLIGEGDEVTGSIYTGDHIDWAWQQMLDRYGDDFGIAFDHDWDKLTIEDADAASIFIGGDRAINSTRLEYTTNGLSNKREIALVVPTIEPWKENDDIHFGDAGEGRAVAWVRFGETTDEAGNRVLVIDEIQSNRHQEGRENGYISDEVIEAQRQRDYLYNKMYKEGLTEEERNRYYFLGEFIKDNFGIVPSAPFDKNWHEVAMKRILRYAAENGYDKVAWTTGDQQAERYDISKTVDSIKSEDNDVEEASDGTLIVKNITIYAGGSVYNLFVGADGVVRGSQFNGKTLADIVGKPLADKLMEKGDFELEGDNLRIGGEGMRAFYDQILPNFMNKYGKKWGVKVGEVTMPNLAENNTMHSVDITPAMRESVMQGQPLFSLRQPTAEEMADNKAEREAIEREARTNGTWLKAPNGQPTNLTPEQWVNVRTSRFKEWFGDWENDPENASKVVDANGEPKVVYHGSNWKGITTFDRSQSKRRRSGLREYGHFFTTNRALAELYSAVDDAPEVVEELARLDAQIETAAENKDIDKMLDLYTEKERITRNLGGRVYEVFLNMRDVAEFDANYQADRGWYNLKADVGYKTAIGRDAMEAYAGQNSMTGDRLRKDGIIGRNIIDLFVGTENKEALRPYYDKFGGDVFLVFDPQNIKSATDNAGTYSSENPDIRHSLRLPQYTDAFAALKEEYNALDKNNAKALADFRARKREVAEEHWADFAREIGADVEAMVIDSTNNPEALRPIYDIVKGMTKESVTFEEFVDEYNNQEDGLAFHIPNTRIIVVDMAKIDSCNTQKESSQLFVHEYVHCIIEENIPKRDLARVWMECAGRSLGKALRRSYPDRGSASLGNEILAYSIAGLRETDIAPLFDFIEGVEGVSVEDVMAMYKKALPLRNEIASKILNIIKDEYNKKRELANAVDEEALSGLRGEYEGRVGDENYGRRDGGYSAGNSYSESGRGEDVAEEEYDIYEVSGEQFDESPRYSLRDPIEQIRKEGLTRTGRKLDDVNKEDLPAAAEQYGKESVGRKVERAVFNHLVDVERLQENLYAAGVEKADDNDFINAFEAVRNIVAAKMPNDFNNYIQPLLDIITDLSGKKYGFSYTDVSDYLAAKHSLEREDVSDISTMSTEEGAAWTREKCEQIVAEFEGKVPGSIQEKLWDAVRAIEKRTLDILLDAGVYTEADIEAIQSHGWEYYVPLQGWDAATENLIEADKIYETPKRGGSTGGKWQEHSAKGRRTKPYDPISTIVSKMNKALYVAETNKALLKLYNLISDGTKVLGKEEASMQFKVSEAYYRNTPEGYVEIDPDDVSQEELKANRKLHSELKKLYAERKKIGKYKNVQRWRRYNYELKRANEAGDVERSNTIQERLDSLRQTKGVQLLFEVDAKIADVKSQLTIFIKAGDMAIPREVNPSNELTRARRVYFYLNGRRMYVQFTNPKYSSAINGRTIVQRNGFDNWVGGLNAWLARSYTTYNPEFAFVTNPIRDFRDAMNWHLLDVDNGNIGGFVNHYVFHWNSTRNAIYRAQRGNANPLTSEELKDFNILNKDDRRAIARIYGRDRLLDTLFEWFAENGGVISYKKAFKTPEAAKNFFGQPQKVKASDFNGHANVYEALQDSAEIITRYATFLASLDKGQSVGQAVANGRNVSVNFNRKGELSTRLGAYYQFFNASAQGIYKYIKLARKRPGRFFGLCMYHAVMGYVSSLLIDWLFTSLFPDNDDDELTNVEIPLWERLGYTVFPVKRENGKVHTIRIPKSQNMVGFSAIGVLINEVIKGRIAPKEAIVAGLNQLAAAWTYGFSEGAPLIRSIIPSGVPQLAFDLWNNTDAFGREIYRTDKYNTRLPAVEFGKKNVIPWVYDVCSYINKAAGGNEYRSSGKLTDINPSVVQYLMEQLSGGYGVLARKGLELTTSAFYDEVEFEAQNLPALGRVMYTVEPKSWYPEYSTIQKGFDYAASKNARSELNAGYITQEEYEDIAKRAGVYNGFNKHISALRQLRDDFPSNSGVYRDINREVNRKMGLVTKIFEETDWSAPKYWESIDGVIEKYDPYWRESIDNLFKEYGKKE